MGWIHLLDQGLSACGDCDHLELGTFVEVNGSLDNLCLDHDHLGRFILLVLIVLALVLYCLYRIYHTLALFTFTFIFTFILCLCLS